MEEIVSAGNNHIGYPTYAFQIPVDDLVVMQIVEPTGDPDQLRTRERKIRYPWLRPTRSKRLAPGYFLTYPCMFPFAIHRDTMQNSNNLGATPSIDKMFGWFARLHTITSLQYF